MQQPVKIPRHKSVYILPNLFTTASLFSGFLGILWAADGQYESCALAIFFSALMDGLDGKVARLTGTSSEFGIQFDSLADLVAFGVAPGFLIFQAHLRGFDRLGIALAFHFTVCSALRLARFNIQTATANKRFFTGLPAPAAGCSLAGLVLIAPHMPEFLRDGPLEGLLLFLTGAIAFLMVSNIRYASFKELGAFKAHPFRSMVFVILVFALVAAYPKVFGFLLIFGYILSGLAYTFVILPRKAAPAGRGLPAAAAPDPDKDSPQA
ncbi:MAG: CDP-diacylglycerol--serine O-phosphatidyltransferase [Desulfovibrio sp.]|jgi:CDP-diacylglycerol--serine O-phosphatidyltransferase|nr:CDP-diacylglycerol--serine O-phosphatidyltransferase [Desulfovibrio sp.]